MNLEESLREIRLCLEPYGFLPMDSYPGLVGSGTLTPEIFQQSFVASRPFWRIQPVFRPLDSRRYGARFHQAVFTQIQIFTSGSLVSIEDAILTIIRAAVPSSHPELSMEAIRWSASSIGGKGVGREIQISGMEVGQTNEITHMGGVQLKKSTLLVAIGIERLALANNLKDQKSSFAIPPYGDYTIDWLQAAADRLLQQSESISPELIADHLQANTSVVDILAMLGDAQTSLDVSFAVGRISTAYRQLALRRFGRAYKYVGALLDLHGLGDPCRNQPIYKPKWTISALTNSLNSHDATISIANNKASPEFCALAAHALNKNVHTVELTLLDEGFSRTVNKLQKDEFVGVLQLEHQKMPYTKYKHALKTLTEVGNGADRCRRMTQVTERILLFLDCYTPASCLIVKECKKITLLSMVSFIDKISPIVSVENMEFYLCSFRFCSALQLLRTREMLPHNRELKDESEIIVAAYALAEAIDSLLVKLAIHHLTFSSSVDPFGIRRLTRLAVRLARMLALGEAHIVVLFQEAARELDVRQILAQKVFDETIGHNMEGSL